MERGFPNRNFFFNFYFFWKQKTTPTPKLPTAWRVAAVIHSSTPARRSAQLVSVCAAGGDVQCPKDNTEGPRCAGRVFPHNQVELEQQFELSALTPGYAGSPEMVYLQQQQKQQQNGQRWTTAETRRDGTGNGDDGVPTRWTNTHAP